MNRRRTYALVTGLTIVAAVVLVLAFVVLPDSPAGVSDPEVASVEIAEPAAVLTMQEVTSKPSGPDESITIHGRWTIEVRNPDGSLMERREFDNALHSDGKEVLTKILAREATLGRWRIDVYGTPDHPCNTSGGAAVYCQACEPGAPEASQPYGFDNLTITKVGTDDSAKLVLSGSVIVANTTEISHVATSQWYCDDASVATADCASASASLQTHASMTSYQFDPRIAVQAGQQVLVTVEISFS